MTSALPGRRTVTTVSKRFRTITAYSRRQPATGWAAGAGGEQLELTAMAAAAA